MVNQFNTLGKFFNIPLVKILFINASFCFGFGVDDQIGKEFTAVPDNNHHNQDTDFCSLLSMSVHGQSAH